MKKTAFIVGIVIAVLFTLQQANASLWGLYKERGESLPSFLKRQAMALDRGFNYYSGTKEQNNVLEKILRDDERLGFSVVTRYRTTLSASLTSTATTVNVSSMRTFDDTTLTMALLGEAVFLTIDPGNSREEIVRCTGISGNSFTGCTRGLAFSGTNITGVSANQKAHSSGSVIIMSNTHYVYEQFPDKDSEREYVSGTKWFTSNGMILGDGLTTKKFFYFCDSLSTSTCGYFFAQTSSTAAGSQELGFSTDGTTASEFVLNSGGTVFSVGNGLQLVSGVMSIRLAPTSTGGLGFLGNQLGVSTTFPNGLLINSDGLGLATSSQQSWSASTSFTGNASNGVYMQNATTTNATTTFLGSLIVSSTNMFAFSASTTNVTTTNLFAGGKSTTPLFGVSTTPANEFHYHASQCEVKSYSYASGNTLVGGSVVTFAHTLGVAPSFITFNAMASVDTGNAYSHGTWTSSTNVTTQFAMYGNNEQAATDNAVTASVIQLIEEAATVRSSATMITPTNTREFSLTVGTNGSAAPDASRRFTATICK